MDFLLEVGHLAMDVAKHELLKTTAVTVGTVLGSVVLGAGIATWEPQLFRKHIDGNGGTISAARLKTLLNEGKVPRRMSDLTVQGTFFPGALLTFGWWERSSKQLVSNEWKDPSLQNWLFSSFEQWAPSWNFNELSSGQDSCFVGQVGTNDEADSIVVIVTNGAKAAKLRMDLGHKVVCNVTIRGRLMAYTKLIDKLKKNDKYIRLRHQLEVLNNLGIAPAHYIHVSDEFDSFIELNEKKVDYYSGYIWQCWVPEEWIDKSNVADTEVNGAYFLWEHTNLADADVVRYSMDGLVRKKAFLEKRIKTREIAGRTWSGKLSMLQHVMNEKHLSRGTYKSESAEIRSVEFLRMLRGKTQRQ